MHSVILVDDDKDIRELLSDYLEKNGFNVTCFDSAETLLEAGVEQGDLLILDVGLPGMDGLSLCRELRKTTDLPIIMLTAASDDVDRILGLEFGADDYMGKPFNPRELLARLKALLRRISPNPPPSKDRLLVMDSKKRLASFKGHVLDLTGAEFDLLSILLKHSGEVVSRDTLSLDLKGHPTHAFNRSIDTLVSRLRTKLSQHTEIEPIKAVRGKGYLLALS